MKDFDLDAYLNNKLGAPNPGKIDAIIKAKEAKLANLQQIQSSLAQNGQQALNAQAVADGRTWGEFGADVGLSAIQGVDALAKLPAMVYDKATEGNFYGTETQAISKMSDEREKLKSAFAQANNKQKAQAAKAAGEAAKEYVGDGALGTGAQIAAESGSAFWEAAKDPASIPEFLAQQAAQLGVMGKVGKASEIAAQAALKAAPVLAATKAGQAAVNRVGTAGAVGTGAVLQGTDVGSDTMTRIMELPDKVWEQNPEFLARSSEIGASAAKQEIASRLASEATIQGAATSILSAALPGGTAVEKALVGKSLGGVKAIPKAFVGESGQEGIEEGTGKFFGNAGVKQINPAQSLSEDVGAAAGQGAYMGGLLGAGITGVQTAGNAAAQSAAERAAKVQEETGKKQDLSAAIASGDVTAYVDPKSPSYAPEKAVQALFGNSQKEDATPEIKQTNFAKAETIVADLKSKREDLQLEIEGANPDKLQERLDQNRSTFSPALVAALESEIATLRSTPPSPTEIKIQADREARAKTMDSQIELAEKVLKAFIPETQNTQVDVEAEVAKLKDADPVVAQGAADNIINLSMSSPELVDRKLVASLVSDTTNNLTDSQRDYLRAFSEARVAENSLKTMGDVSKEIFFGSQKGKAGIKYTGLVQYRSNVATSLAAGNQKSADRELGLLTAFETSHQAKATAASEAYSAFLKDGIERRVVRNKDGSWKVEQGLWESASARAENGGLNIKEDSPKIVADTKTEADAISKTASELKAAYAVKFGSGNTSGASNVQNVSQAPAGVQGTQEKFQAKATTETGTTETVAAAGTGNAAPATSNAPTGIDAVVDPAQEAPASVVSTVETAVDQAQLQSTEQTTATSEEFVPQTEAVAEPTGLSALQQKSTEGTPYVERNLLADHLKQSGKRPLVMVKDFVTALKQQTAKVMDYLDVKDPTDKQKAAVQLLARKLTEWSPVIKANLVKGYWNKEEGRAKENENFRYTDLMQFLIEGTNKTGLDLEENIKTAIVYAAMRATVDSADENKFNSPEDINAMFGRSDEQEVSESELRILANVGVRDNTWRNRAGQAAVQALGLKAADENTPIDLLPRLESAFGAYIQKLLMDRGIMVRETLSRDLMEELFVEPVVTTLKVGTGAAGQVSYDQKTLVVSGSGATPSMWVKAYLPDGYRVKAKADKQGNFVLPTLSQIPSVGTEIVIEMLTSEAPPSWQFIKLARDAEGNAVPAAQQILEGLQGTGNVLDKLFGVESLVRFPLLQAAEFKDKSQKGVNEGIPENLREAVNQKQQEAGYLRKDSWAVLSALPEQAFLEMHGWVDIENTTIQAMDLLSVQAKNEGIVREYNRIKQFVSEVIQPAATEADTELGAVPFYPEMFVAKQQRVFQKTNGFNQQTSKMHRNVYRKGSWAVNISVSDETAMDNFRLRVLEALGTKTDAQTNDRTLAQFDAAFDPELQSSDKGKKKAAALRDAVKALQKIIYEGASLSDAEVNALVDGVAKGGEKGLTLAALQDMAHYMQAMETGAETFPVQFQGEIDGKTNGVIISQILFGGAVSVEDMKNRMRRGGLFFEGDEQSQFNSWKQEGNLDQYESLAKRLNEIAQLSLDNDPVVYGAIEAFTKPLSTADGQVAKEGRDFTKNPLTTLMFGSTLYSAVDKMGDKLIAQVSKRIVDVVDGNTPSTMKEVLQDLNVLITRGGGKPINVNMTNAQALSSELSTDQIKAIKRAFHNSLGDAAKQAFEEEFGTYLKQRSIADEAANLTFALSNAVITGMREDYVKQLIADGTMPTNTAGQPIRALTQKEEREFQKQVSKLIPRVHTAGSKKDNKQSSGIGLFKTKQTLSTNPVFQGDAKFGTPFADTIGKTGRQGQSLEAFSTKLNSNERVQEEPGISTSSKQVHSFDSTVARGAETLLAAQGIETDNNHDALTSGLNGFSKVGEALNQSFYSELSQYSPMGELSASLNGMLQNIIGFAVQGEGNNLTPTAQKNLAAVLNELVKTYGLDAAASLNLIIKNTADAAYRADKMKLETLADVVSVDQYTLEGGNYKPTADERQAIQNQLAALSPEVKLGVFEAVDSLVSLMGDTLTAPKARENKTRGKTEFGDLGASSVRHDPDLVGVFEKRGQLTAKQLVHVLRKKFPDNTVNREILEKLVPLLNAGLVVKYITPDAASADVLEMATEPSRGWFVSKGGKQEIYVLGTQFKDSGLTAELLLHEALHAALSQVINRPQSADAKALVAELQTLLTEAKAIVASDASLSGFSSAVSSVDELVSWGLTNKDFQVKVLSKVRMQSRTSQNRLVSGMKAFVDAVASLLFRRPDKNQNHGVFVLVQNVSGLMAEAANTQPATDVNLSMASQVEQINSFTTLQIHEALDTGAVDPAFQSQLANLLTGIVDALHGPFGAFAAALRETEAKTPTDAWAKAKELGVAPFGSSVLSHMAASEQEAFAIEQVEATVKAALDGNDAQAKIAYRELYNLYTEMYNKFSKDGSDFFKGDWAMATPSEKAHAKSQYDFVFDLKSDNGDRSDYLARFAALGLAHQGFNQMLQVTTESDVGKLRGKESFEQRLQRWFSNVLGFFRQRVTKTYAGQLADVKLQTLVGQLVDIEAKKRSLIQAKKGLINTGMVEDGARAITEGIRTKIAQAADSEFLRKQKNTAVQVARSAVSTIANDRTEKYIEGMQRFYERNVQAQGSMFVSVLKELTGHKEKLQAAFRIVKKFEGDRQDQIAGWAKDARKAFGKKILRDSSASITAVVMRTGLHYLSDTMSLTEIERLVDNPVAQNAAIAELEAKLGHMKAEYVTQIKGLGYYKATELVKVKTLMMNSYLISRLAGTVYEKQITEAQANAAEPIIKQLVSLYALKYTSRTEQALAKQVFRDENARGESVGNGIDFVMKAQKALEQEAFERQFMNNPALMVHGFTPEILNPHTEFVVATEAEGEALVDFNYKKGDKVSKDSADPDQSQKYIYVLKGAGLAPHVSGALQFQSDTAKGTKAHSGYMNVNTQDGLENAQTQARFDQKLGSKIETDPNWDPSQEAGNYTAPLYNENGKVVNWRYMMNKQTKDELLDRNNSFDRVLGVLGGTVFSKPKIKEQNRAVLEALKEIYKDDFALNAEAYVEVGPKSSDPELRGFWERLPEQTKEDVRAVWKGDSMKVTADSLDVVFGYRKLSLADPIRQSQKNKAKLEAGGALTEAEKQGLIAQNFVLSVEWAFSTYARIKLGKSQDEAERYAKRAAAYVVRGERAWQEIVREIKTIYVIKGVTSMINNNKSNLSQLLASGVTLQAIREHMPVALKSAMAYQADSDELRELENRLETGYTQGNEAEIERKIIRLRDAIARNPAREMIEAGLMPSIVEDVGEADDPFSYKTELAKKTERFTDKLNPKVKEAAKFVYMTRDGKLYKALHQATQISDFVARYVMYQHRISREQNPLSKAAAIQEAADAFVNYDMAMHRNIQFMDDMGFMMFTKYYLRMQKVLLKMGRENPARVLALAAADGYLNLGSIVLDSSALAKIGNNPFGVGAFGFPGALDDLATVKAAMALVK